MRAHDMSDYWRLVNISGGRVTGTFWVQASSKRGAVGWVRAVDVTVWVDDDHTWGRTLDPFMTASVKDGKVDLSEHMISPDAGVRKFVLARRADVEAAILAASEAVDWSEDA